MKPSVRDVLRPMVAEVKPAGSTLNARHASDCASNGGRAESEVGQWRASASQRRANTKRAALHAKARPQRTSSTRARHGLLRHTTRPTPRRGWRRCECLLLDDLRYTRIASSRRDDADVPARLHRDVIDEGHLRRHFRYRSESQDTCMRVLSAVAPMHPCGIIRHEFDFPASASLRVHAAVTLVSAAT